MRLRRRTSLPARWSMVPRYGRGIVHGSRCRRHPYIHGRHDDDGTKGKVTNNGDGTFTYDPNGAFIGLKAGATATDKFRYTVTDGSGASSTATVTIAITGENDAPAAQDVAANVRKHGPAKSVTASFTDPDVGDTHSFSIDAATDATKGKVTNNGDGTFTYDPNGAFISLKAGVTATDKFLYTVTDGSGVSSTATVTMTIVGENDAPTAQNGAANVQEHGPANDVPTATVTITGQNQAPVIASAPRPRPSSKTLRAIRLATKAGRAQSYSRMRMWATSIPPC